MCDQSDITVLCLARFPSPITSPSQPEQVIIHQPLPCCSDMKLVESRRASDRGFLRVWVDAKVCSVCACVLVSYPRWMVRMCLWMPAAVLSTLPQFFHRHLNITFMEFCRKHTTGSSCSQGNTGAQKCLRTERDGNPKLVVFFFFFFSKSLSVSTIKHMAIIVNITMSLIR